MLEIFPTFDSQFKIKFVNDTGNETFERLAAFGLFANFMVYLTREFHLDQVYASNILNMWSGITNFAPLLGAFISDTYTGRFKAIAFGSFFSLLVRILFILYQEKKLTSS